MLLIIARILSILFYPLVLIIPLPFFLVFRFTRDVTYAFQWTIFSYVFLGIGGVFMLFAVWRGIFSDLDVSKRKQRPLLFFVFFLIALVYLVALLYFHGPPVLLFAVSGVLMSILFISMVNRRIKASLHMATITAVLLIIGILYGINSIVFFLIPLVGWARVKAKRHTVQETIVGGLSGAFVIAVIYVSIRYIFHLNL
ncbi:hypothetical protein BH11PAT1_BH11PAT1_1630 [soil metagenome]